MIKIFFASLVEKITPKIPIIIAGIKVYAIEDCVIATVHANPTDTEDLNELAKINIVFTWEEYNEYKKTEK